MTVLVIGSVNIDSTYYVDEFPCNGETIVSSRSINNLGGKGINQAIAIARGGIDVTFLGVVGNDFKSNKEVIKVLKKEKKLKLRLAYKDVSTGKAIIEVNKHGENKIIIYSGANSYLTKDIIDLNIDLIKNADIICLQNEIPISTNEYILFLAKKYSKTIIYNPAPYIKFKDNLYAKIDYLLPNESELNAMTKGKTIENKCEYLLSKGVKNIIVTLGNKGAYYKNSEKSNYFPAIKQKHVVDTVGAGDTFNGYFATGLAKNLDIEKCINLALKASGLSVTRLGSTSSIPYLKELK